MIKDKDTFELDSEVLHILLKDNSSGKNIIWAIDDYAYLGDGYLSHQHIKENLITGDKGYIIKSRIFKTKDTQKSRSKEKAEVFTPSWVCNAQNNLVDNVWFGIKYVFNILTTIFKCFSPPVSPFWGRIFSNYVRHCFGHFTNLYN